MSIPSIGPVSFSDLRALFPEPGAQSGVYSLSDLRWPSTAPDTNNIDRWIMDATFPTSGQVSVSDAQGKGLIVDVKTPDFDSSGPGNVRVGQQISFDVKLNTSGTYTVTLESSRDFSTWTQIYSRSHTFTANTYLNIDGRDAGGVFSVDPPRGMGYLQVTIGGSKGVYCYFIR